MSHSDDSKSDAEAISISSSSISTTGTAYTVDPMTPAQVYTPTPTANTPLPYNTPEASCKNAFQHLSNGRIRMDMTDGFPNIEPTAMNQMQIISENNVQIVAASEQQQHDKDAIDADDSKQDDAFSLDKTSISSALHSLKINTNLPVKPRKANEPQTAPAPQIQAHSKLTQKHSNDDQAKPRGHKRAASKNRVFKLMDVDADLDLNRKQQDKTPTKQAVKEQSEQSKKAQIEQELKNKLEEKTLLQHGYKKVKFLANTLQGHVMTARRANVNGDADEEGKEGKEAAVEPKDTVVIKTSSKTLYRQRITVQKNGKRYKVEEDIVKEAGLMKQFMDAQHPSSLIDFHAFFEDDDNYYLVMENGGTDLFDFVVNCHELLVAEKLSLREWRKHVKFMFAQMVLFVGWMHRSQHCCNLDVSLENMLITHDVKMSEKEDSFQLNKCYIKFIDFGLTEQFDMTENPCFLCNKFVGKQRYKAPEVYKSKGTFTANKADIWSLGVCLFMMVIGSPPYDKPIDSDIAFTYVARGRISDLCQSWGRLNYLTANLLDLLKKMLCVDPVKRISMDKIMQHPWIKVYFPAKPTKQTKHHPNFTPNIHV